MYQITQLCYKESYFLIIGVIRRSGCIGENHNMFRLLTGAVGGSIRVVDILFILCLLKLYLALTETRQKPDVSAMMAI